MDILIVDDNWMNREILETHLELAGYDLASANSGEKALRMAAEDPPQLVILDLKMPGMDGIEVCRRLKNAQQTSLTSVLVITTLNDERDIQKAMDAGADDFLPRAFIPLVMLTRVKTLLKLHRLLMEHERS